MSLLYVCPARASLIELLSRSLTVLHARRPSRGFQGDLRSTEDLEKVFAARRYGARSIHP
jgi:hypothetical protein